MKITIESKATKEIEVPKYFKQDTDYYMIKEDCYVRINDRGYDPFLGLFPSIEVNDIHSLKYYLRDFEHISETQFKTVFIKVSVLIEEIFSN